MYIMKKAFILLAILLNRLHLYKFVENWKNPDIVLFHPDKLIEAWPKTLKPG